MNLLVLFAQDDTPLSTWSDPGSSAKEILIAIGVMATVVFLLFLWAAFWRKPRHRHHSHLHPDAQLPRREKRKSRLFRGSRRHRRHRRQEHHPLNPTLSQVGGLPPQRRDQPPDH